MKKRSDLMRVKHGSSRKILRLACLVIVTLTLILPGAVGADEGIFEIDGNFKIERPCKGYTSKNTHSGEVDLEVNNIYVAKSENTRVNASHVRLVVDGKQKWAALDCGNYAGEKPPFKNNENPQPEPPADCLKFFDDENNPVNVGFGGNVDITPSAPPIEPFGADVNTMCGAPGKKTNRNEFKALMKKHPAVLADLMSFTGGKVFPNRSAQQDPESYLEELTQAWYALSAFDHIYCGEPKSNGNIGGLHYQGRYQQLQESGEACRMPNYPKNEVVPGSIYTMGVNMNFSGGRTSSDQIKGYGLTLSASDILLAATRAFVENPTSSAASTGCILDLTDGQVKMNTVFVRRAKGIRTFYPDATPDLNRNPYCSSPIVLPKVDELDPVCGGTSDGGQTIRAGRFQIRVIGSDENGFDMRVTECE